MSGSKHTFRNMTDKLFHKDSTNTAPAQDIKETPAPLLTKKDDPKNAMGMHADDSKASVPLHKETPVLIKETPILVKETPILIKETPVLVERNVSFQETPIVHSKTYAPIIETHVNPTVLEQTVRRETVVEVQPIIHRMVEEPEVHVIEKHIFEKVPSMGPTTITKTAIVEETIKPRIIEEIQPVLHRDVPAPYIKHVEEHISEHQVLPTVHTKEIVNEKRAWTAEQAIEKGFVTAYVAPLAPKEPVVHSHREAALVDTHLNATVVEQTTRAEKVVEIQPIIHREIDAPEVHLIEKHMHETVPMTGPRTITKTAIVEEEIHPTIVEEIMPVIHREVPEMVVEKVEAHTTEEVVLPTMHTKEILKEQRVGEAVPLIPLNTPVASKTPIVVSATAKATLTSNTHSTLVEETARPEEILEVQPIVHRDVDAPEVHVIEKHMYEKVASVGPKKVVNQAIVEETVVPKVLEEVRPVVHREVPVAVVERVEEHIKEDVLLDATKTKEVYIDGIKVLDTDLPAHRKEKL